MSSPNVQGFFDESTNTVSYVVSDPNTGSAAIVDPVLDYDAASGRTSTESAEALISFVRHQQLSVDWILETHVHADHLSAAPYFKQRFPHAYVCISGQIARVQATYKSVEVK